MQKVLNILFIMIIVAIASITPLNRALLDINIFSPVVEHSEEPETIIERIEFVGIDGYQLAGRMSDLSGSSQEYWTDVNPDTHLLGFFETGRAFAVPFLFSSNTGEFQAEFPRLQLRINDEEPFDIRPNRDELNISGMTARFAPKWEGTEAGLRNGYNRVTLIVEGANAGYFIVSENARIGGDFMRYETSIPENFKVIKMYFPDIANEDLIPVSRIYPSYFFDYIMLFENLFQGAKTGYGLREKPAVVHTNAYWISNQEARVDYRSSMLQDVGNRELMYKAIGYTFAQLGHLKKTHVYVDGIADMSLETPVAPFYYDFKEGEGGHLLILEKSSAHVDASAHISAFVALMYDRNVLPPHCKLINCENKDGVLHIDISHYEDMENAEVFEPLLNLTAYSLAESGRGIEAAAGEINGKINEVRLNGTPMPKIRLFNVE